MLADAKSRFEAFWQVLLDFYDRYDRFIPVIFFLAGFIYDTLTLDIENPVDHIILLLYVVFAGILILLIGLIATDQLDIPWLLTYRRWYPNILQFLLGGLFSAYVVFYFKSASIDKSLIFIFILLALLLLNEFLSHRLLNITFLATLYFFSTFAFLTFFLPWLTKSLTQATFFSSGAIGFVITAGILTAIYHKIFRKQPERIFKTASPSLMVFGLMSFFYLANWIPPVPLALKDGGIFHHVSKNSETDKYQVQYFRRYPFQFWVDDDRSFRYVEGDTVFCFASVYAPVDWRAEVHYQWQKYDENTGEYIKRDRLKYKINGGRPGGYRGYTYKRNIEPGKWRVDIESEWGQILGRIDFELAASDSAGRGRRRTDFR